MDEQEPVTVTLSIQDWATVINGLSLLDIPLSMKARINTAIFESARQTQRVLS
jgi:hypothetical protein